VQKSGTYLKFERIYSKYSVKIFRFLVTMTPRKPSVWFKNLGVGDISYIS